MKSAGKGAYAYAAKKRIALCTVKPIACCHGYHVILRQSALSWGGGGYAPQTLLLLDCQPKFPKSLYYNACVYQRRRHACKFHKLTCSKCMGFRRRRLKSIHFTGSASHCVMKHVSQQSLNCQFLVNIPSYTKGRQNAYALKFHLKAKGMGNAHHQNV